MSNLGLSQLLKVPGFQGPSLTPDDCQALLDAPPILLKRRAIYLNRHALHSELVCQNHSPCAQTQVFDARGAPKAVSLKGTKRKGNSRTLLSTVTKVSRQWYPRFLRTCCQDPCAKVPLLGVLGFLIRYINHRTIVVFSDNLAP